MKKYLWITFLLSFLIAALLIRTANRHWVATWATALQVVEPHNLPPAPYLNGNSLRQIVQTSIGGRMTRLRFSNEFGEEPVVINAAEIAVALTSGESPSIDESSQRTLLFDGSPSVTIPPGKHVLSDPLRFRIRERGDVAITLHFGSLSAEIITGHPGSRTTSYIAAGNTSDFTDAVRTAHWYIINDIEVTASGKSGAVVVLGDSITDGRGTTTDGQNRWTDILSARLLGDKSTRHLSVLNMGLGGNCVLEGGLGSPASSRYVRDLFGQEGVKYIVLFEGVNDIGPEGESLPKAEKIIAFYKQVAEEAHAKDIKVIGATVMPFKGNNYYTPEHEAARRRLNGWIRSYEGFDGVIDFADVMADAEDARRLNPAFLFEDDWLHPNADGYLQMGSSVSLELFK